MFSDETLRILQRLQYTAKVVVPVLLSLDMLHNMHLVHNMWKARLRVCLAIFPTARLVSCCTATLKKYALQAFELLSRAGPHLAAASQELPSTMILDVTQ